MPDLNDQITLIRMVPRPFTPSGSRDIPVTYTIAGSRSRYRAFNLRFEPFMEGATSVNAIATGGYHTVNNRRYVNPLESRIDNVQGEFPSGTRIRIGAGQSAFIIRLTSAWAPGTQGLTGPYTPMAIESSPGGVSITTTVAVATDVDYSAAAPTVASSTVYWGRLVEQQVNEDVDDLGNEMSIYNAAYLLRFDQALATDANLASAAVTDSLGIRWSVVGIELEPESRRGFMRLRLTR